MYIIQLIPILKMNKFKILKIDIKMSVSTTLTSLININIPNIPNGKFDLLLKSINYFPPTYFPGNKTLIDEKSGSIYQLDILVCKSVLIPKKSTITDFPIHYNEIISTLSKSITILNCSPEVVNGMMFRLYTYIPSKSSMKLTRYSRRNLNKTKTILGHSLSEESVEYIFDFKYDSKFNLLDPIIPVREREKIIL